MKFLIFAIVAIFTVKAQQLTSEQVNELLIGYIDGLLGVTLKNEETECLGTLDTAKYQFNEGFSKIQRTLDFWMPFNKKSQLFAEGMNEMLETTPKMVMGLTQNCNIVGEDGDIILAWQKRNPNLPALMMKVSKNITKNILTIAGTMVGAATEMFQAHYYDAGHQVGHLVDTLILWKILKN